MKEPSLALVGADILDIESGRLILNQTILVSGSRISAIRPACTAGIPEGTLRVECAGKTVIPGLVDMHVHIVPHQSSDNLNETEAIRRAQQFLLIFLASGVTTIRNMAGTSMHLQLREQVRDGTILGPRIYSCGPILETRFTFAAMEDFAELVRNPAEARAEVQRQHAQGFDFIKVYNDIDVPVYDAIIETARELGMQVVGHVAFQKGLDGALTAKQDSIEHLRSYDFAADTRSGDVPFERYVGWLHTNHQRLEELAERTAAAGVWNAPTLVIDRALPTDEEMAIAREPLPDILPDWLVTELDSLELESLFSSAQRGTIAAGRGARAAMVKALDDAGAGLLAGSDCPGCRLVPGQSILRELELLVEAGLSPWRALRTATINAAHFLGQPCDGVIAVNSRADMVILNSSPLENISAIRQQHGVVAGGRWLPTGAIERMLAATES